MTGLMDAAVVADHLIAHGLNHPGGRRAGDNVYFEFGHVLRSLPAGLGLAAENPASPQWAGPLPRLWSGAEAHDAFSFGRAKCFSQSPYTDFRPHVPLCTLVSCGSSKLAERPAATSKRASNLRWADARLSRRVRCFRLIQNANRHYFNHGSSHGCFRSRNSLDAAGSAIGRAPSYALQRFAPVNRHRVISTRRRLSEACRCTGFKDSWLGGAEGTFRRRKKRRLGTFAHRNDEQAAPPRYRAITESSDRSHGGHLLRTKLGSYQRPHPQEAMGGVARDRTPGCCTVGMGDRKPTSRINRRPPCQRIRNTDWYQNDTEMGKMVPKIWNVVWLKKLVTSTSSRRRDLRLSGQFAAPRARDAATNTRRTGSCVTLSFTHFKGVVLNGTGEEGASLVNPLSAQFCVSPSSGSFIGTSMEPDNV